MSTSSSKSKTSRHSPRNPKKDRKSLKATQKGESSKTVLAKQVESTKATTSGIIEKKASSGKEIRICVTDDCKKMTETFTFEYDVLVEKMPYFQDIAAIKTEDDLEITIHCDIPVFKIIMEYINIESTQDTKKFKFDPKYAVHLLVSADFLRMSSLVSECLTYCHRHMNLILETGCPVTLLNEPLWSKLVSLFSPRDVETLKEPLVAEKFYETLLELLLKPFPDVPAKSSSSQKLFKCSTCEQVLATKVQSSVSCKNGRGVIGPRGEVVYTHKRDINWSTDKYIEDSYQSLGSWRNVYWKTWGLLNILHCTTCMLDFSCSDFMRCRYHKEPLDFPPSQSDGNDHDMGTYSCCGTKSYRFDPSNPLLLLTGCAYRNHTVSSSVRASDVFQDMLTYSDLMCATDAVQAPPPPTSENYGFSKILCCFSERAVAEWSFAVNLNFLIKTGSKQSISSEGSGSVTTKSSESLSVILPWKEPKNLGVFRSVLVALSHIYSQSEVKQVWKRGRSLFYNQDAVREYDARQMDLLILQLQKIYGGHRLRGNSPRKP